MALTLYEKIFNRHVVREDNDTYLIYIDRHLVHEVTSPQAFEGLRMADRKIWRTNSILAVPDHNVPTTDREKGILDPISKIQIDTLDDNCKKNKLMQFQMDDVRQGIVHVIGPEQGSTLPGMTIVCGDSHTSTHGAFGALAVGIGTSEVEHVLATQCLILKKFKTMLINVKGTLGDHVSAKDIALNIIGQIGTAGGTGHAIEFAGSAIKNLSMEGRMTLCNMAIEAGSRAGLIGVDNKTIDYLKSKPFAPTGESWQKAVTDWKNLVSDKDAQFDKKIEIDASSIEPQVTWGTSPEMVCSINDKIPDPLQEKSLSNQRGYQGALEYMGLKQGTSIKDIKLDKIFIGSCTNSRIEDLRKAADIVKTKKVATNIKLALVVPGSGLVKNQAEEEGLDKIFINAGFEWRDPGCSMCLAMNADRLEPHERCASTSNRNFEGRQGQGGRTHLVSPEMAAAAAIHGKFVDVREAFLMLPINKHQGIVIPLDRANVDTDAIIPKQFLKSIKKSGFGPNLFDEWRYLDHGEPGINPENRKLNPDFILNKQNYREGTILLARENFGCGSSREHAPWALLDYGIRIILAPNFADIFYGNCFKNGILPIQISNELTDLFFKKALSEKGLNLTINLERQVIFDDRDEYDFKVDEFKKHCLLKGLDDIGLTLEHREDIKDFEKHYYNQYPWLIK